MFWKLTLTPKQAALERPNYCIFFIIFQLLLLHGAELIDFEGKNELTEFMSDRIKEIIKARPIFEFEENVTPISESQFKFNFTAKMNFEFSDLLEQRLKATLKNRFHIDVEDVLDGENNIIRYGPLEIFGSKINDWNKCFIKNSKIFKLQNLLNVKVLKGKINQLY